jgi:hypothetical protein
VRECLADDFLCSLFRCINLANATPDELEQLSQACKVSDVASCNAGKMDSKYFSSSLDLVRTGMIEIIRGFLLEGEESTNNIEIEAYKLDIFSAHAIFSSLLDTILLSRQRHFLQS